MRNPDQPRRTCPSCGKLCFISRKEAKRYLHRRFPKGDGMSIYRCRDVPQYFHYGHTPWKVKKGLKAR